MISTLFKTGTSILGKTLAAPGRGIWNSIKVAQKEMEAGKSLADATQGSLNLLKAGWKSTGGGKAINATSRAGASLTKSITRGIIDIPKYKGVYFGGIAVAGAGGLAHGAMTAVSQRMADRQMSASRGMDPNNLGTDGLTLALSRRRHR